MFAPGNQKCYCVGIIIIAMLLPFSVYSQRSYKSKIKKNTFYVELLGAAPIASISYGRQIILSQEDELSLDLGFQYAPFVSNRITAGISPQISYLHGNKNHFEIGFGLFHDFYWGDYIPFPKLGYRYQNKDGGFFYKLELTPMLVYIKKTKTILPWGGVGLGWAF